MIVVAVIGILAAVAVSAYADYVKTAGMGDVVAHYEGGIQVIKNGYAKVQSRAALGILTGTVPASIQEFHDGIFSQLNSDGKKSPGGIWLMRPPPTRQAGWSVSRRKAVTLPALRW